MSGGGGVVFLPCFLVVERPWNGDFLCDKNFLALLLPPVAGVEGVFSSFDDFYFLIYLFLEKNYSYRNILIAFILVTLSICIPTAWLEVCC